MNARFFSVALALPLLAAALSACTMTDDKVGRLLSDPGRYVNYSCTHIVTTLRGTITRQRELEKLMAKAGTDAGGRLVSSMTYRPEYFSARGDINDLRRAAAARQCDLSKADVRGDTASPAPRAAPPGKKRPPSRPPAAR